MVTAMVDITIQKNDKTLILLNSQLLHLKTDATANILLAI